MAIGTIIVRLIVAVLLGGLVGMERENKKRPAGFRTHILVCAGSSVVMLTSELIFARYKGAVNLDPARLGAQVISGIGFLGAGTIIRHGSSVKGLTTAASLWSIACVGLAVGSGFFTIAVPGAIIIYLTLVLLRKFERVLVGESGLLVLGIKIANKPEVYSCIKSFLSDTDVIIRNMELNNEDDDSTGIKISLLIPKGQNCHELILDMLTINGVKSVLKL